ncbi:MULTISPECIES: DUF1684 domain-containing protein [unclassified Pedobacter]|uniref:DUF1684 domain-containing protein n=1 Tax=unclassified Pedobacter TaxID=2628915 RepID=UPI002248597D|nr:MULTISPECIES: DUF1684 domain-containing protein [unclassified Pedobacter]MCX2429470.1 DUF1684 domain-containing protein [Pedobacter sp. GR22-10]MCX2586349.1 DUF1684 domain-containing protein [Pedobacter sp. MR22-3]
MKILPILLLFISLNTLAQSYSGQIAKHRDSYKQDFIKESNSPLKESDLQHLHFYEADSMYKVMAKVDILKNEKIFKMPTYDGTSKEFYRFAKVSFNLNGTPITLTLYKNIALAANPAYKYLLFLPFTDQTNQKETYGGGRYIDLSEKEIKNHRIEIDFNKAYNPYCAYSDGYRCPVPPEENDLPVEIKAGEKQYTGDKKHKN